MRMGSARTGNTDAKMHTSEAKPALLLKGKKRWRKSYKLAHSSTRNAVFLDGRTLRKEQKI
jgi:hypothetical protein